MRGLKTPESDKFLRFHALIEEEAEKQGKVFFGFAGEGRDFETETMEGEDVSGWLIPKDRADEFEKLWLISNNEGLDDWIDYFLFAIWRLEGDEVKVEFKEY